MLAFFLAAASPAAADTVSVSLSADPTTGKPVTVTLDWTTTYAGSYSYAGAYVHAGGDPCAATPELEWARAGASGSDQDRVAAGTSKKGPGTFSYSGTWTPGLKGAYTVCAFLVADSVHGAERARAITSVHVYDPAAEPTLEYPYSQPLATAVRVLASCPRTCTLRGTGTARSSSGLSVPLGGVISTISGEGSRQLDMRPVKADRKLLSADLKAGEVLTAGFTVSATYADDSKYTTSGAVTLTSLALPGGVIVLARGPIKVLCKAKPSKKKPKACKLPKPARN